MESFPSFPAGEISSEMARGEATRQAILTAAMQLFCERGYHGTSMRQIARQADIALGGIYNHFSSKEQLFIEVLYRYHPVFRIIPQLGDTPAADLESFVRGAAQAMVASFDNRVDFIKLMFIELVEFDSVHLPILVQQVMPRALEFSQRFAEYTGQLRPLPPLILTRAFVSLFFAYLMFDLLAGKDLPAEMRQGALEHFIDIFLHGIVREPETEPPVGAGDASAESILADGPLEME